MRIILHGATDYGSSNYGDFLYGKIIYDYLIEKLKVEPKNITFYNPSDYFKKYIDRNRTTDLKGNIAKADIAIYIPGGYFGEGHNASWKETLIQTKRFIPFGIKCISRKVPFAVIGVGAGPNNNLLFRNCIKYVINHADTITVRDKESFDALKLLGYSEALCCADPIIAFDMERYDSESMGDTACDEVVHELARNDKKGILVHFNHSKEAAEKFGWAINIFVKNNPSYYPVVSSDQLLSVEDDLVAIFEKAYGSKEFLRYKYDNPFEFGSLISHMCFVLTSKLHVGVTAASKGKSVLAAAVHPEKTVRFYKQIHSESNFLDLEKTSPNMIAARIDKVKSASITIPDEALEAAKKNMIELKRFIWDKEEKLGRK